MKHSLARFHSPQGREEGAVAHRGVQVVFLRGEGEGVVCLYGVIGIRACYCWNQYPYALLWGLGKVQTFMFPA